METNTQNEMVEDTTATVEATTEQLDYANLYKIENDKYVRLYADFENFKKRTYAEYSNITKTATKDVVLSMITVLDDFERSLNNISNEVDKKGVELVYTKMKDTLKSKGLESYSSKGEEFNSDLHESITQIQSTEDMSGKVVDEIEKGYKLNGVIIRYAKVVVGL